VDAVLAEWLSTGHEGLRFDAMALIREHKIASALPALRALAASLEVSSLPSAPYDWTQVNRTIARVQSKD
jgi:hypothetical protein